VPLYQRLSEDKFPFVVINRTIPEANMHHVVFNNRMGAALAVNHLLRNGRKKVAVSVYRNSYVSTWKERLEGYYSAMQQSGYRQEDIRVLESEQLIGETRETTLAFLKQYPDTDAIFSTNNMMTLEIIEAIKELKLRIPEDIAIVGYDETVWSKHLDPPLTTIWQPGYEMGQIAAKMLVKMINAKRKLKPETVVLEPKLIVRKSSGSVPVE
jgi:DNA-binding LacI/PurR family transcriptional regulator